MYVLISETYIYISFESKKVVRYTYYLRNVLTKVKQIIENIIMWKRRVNDTNEEKNFKTKPQESLTGASTKTGGGGEGESGDSPETFTNLISSTWYNLSTYTF